MVETHKLPPTALWSRTMTASFAGLNPGLWMGEMRVVPALESNPSQTALSPKKWSTVFCSFLSISLQHIWQSWAHQGVRMPEMAVLPL